MGKFKRVDFKVLRLVLDRLGVHAKDDAAAFPFATLDEFVEGPSELFLWPPLADGR